MLQHSGTGKFLKAATITSLGMASASELSCPQKV